MSVKCISFNVVLHTVQNTENEVQKKNTHSAQKFEWMRKKKEEREPYSRTYYKLLYLLAIDMNMHADIRMPYTYTCAPCQTLKNETRQKDEMKKKQHQNDNNNKKEKTTTYYCVF